MAATAGLRTSVRRTRGSESVHMARERAGGMREFEGDAHLCTATEDGRRPSADGPEVGLSAVGPRPATIRALRPRRRRRGGEERGGGGGGCCCGGGCCAAAWPLLYASTSALRTSTALCANEVGLKGLRKPLSSCLALLAGATMTGGAAAVWVASAVEGSAAAGWVASAEGSAPMLRATASPSPPPLLALAASRAL